jgi:hypothetical protein
LSYARGLFFRLVHPLARSRAMAAIQNAPEGWIVTIKAATRTLAQNALLWVLLDDLARQVFWYGKYRLDEDWKIIITASLHGQESVPGIGENAPLVVVGRSTRSMSKPELADLLELIYAFGTQQGVVWSEPKKPRFS